MKNIEEVTTKIKSILESKRYCVQCEYSGSHVPEAELNRANAHGEAQLKNISDADILEAFNYCQDRGSEEDSVTAHTLFRLAEKDFTTPYDNISFLVYLW